MRLVWCVLPKKKRSTNRAGLTRLAPVARIALEAHDLGGVGVDRFALLADGEHGARVEDGADLRAVDAARDSLEGKDPLEVRSNKNQGV